VKQRCPSTFDVNSLSEIPPVTGSQRNKFANAGVGENNIDSCLTSETGLVKTIKVAKFATSP